jgi:8-oxo-dGTP pyrophosphatase MutT (NUDIX family)
MPADFGPSAPPGLGERLLRPEQAAAIGSRGGTDAAVLLALYGWPGEPGLIFTERRADLRRHAGEISFPGGRRDPEDADAVATALREAHEEIGLHPDRVEVAGALPPVPTFVTDYAIYPVVGLIAPETEWTLQPEEVDAVLEFRIADVRAGYGRRRLVRRGIPFRTDTYCVGDDLIWGATARIVADLLDRLDR